jgi:protein-L-isoaspartate(D-aspartate) O-methyltransferase
MIILNRGFLFGIILIMPLFSNTGRAADQGRPKADADDWPEEREAMVSVLRAYGIRDATVLSAMSKVRRHMFIPETHRNRYEAYGDHPCPIGYGQTISQPYIVAYMTEKINVKPGEKILEIGTGSGYQAAILAECGAEVYTIEIIPELAQHARNVLANEGYKKVHVLTGDGYKGWSEHSPFDAIIVTCAPENIPRTLVDQLKDGGRMILPLGTGFQRLVILRKKDGKIIQEDDLPVRFVPMVKP